MANNYCWKDKYYDINGLEVIDPLYVSSLASKGGDGTKENPYDVNFIPDNSKRYVLSGGNYSFNKAAALLALFGSGATTTKLDGVNLTMELVILSDLTVENVLFSTDRVRMARCMVKQPLLISESVANCLIYDHVVTTGNYYYNNNSFINVSDLHLQRTNTYLAIQSNCDVIITEADLATYRIYYIAFDNCRFKIGDEATYKGLTGDTEAELRQNFVDRCMAQGITPPTGSEYGEPNTAMYRWIFSKNSSVGGCVIRDSMIDKFQKRKFVYLGWKQETVEPLSITADPVAPNSIGAVVTDGLHVSDGSISHKVDVDITKQYSDTVTSNIIWLGEGKQKINSINIIHNLAIQYGVLIDSSPSLIPVANGQIEAGELYLVRSANNDLATLTYDEENYTSSLSERNNIFTGVSGKASWSTTDAVSVYKVKDLAVLGTVKMRIVDAIPTDKITTGSLQAGYWYFVEPVDLSNPSGMVSYGGKEYPCFASFLSTGGTFTINGDCRLRRCWKNDFNFSTEAVDKAFWQNIQKPLWFDVVPDDMRCLMKNNSSKSTEMQLADNTYITTGHPDFYKMIDGTRGIPTPAYPISGKYMQLQLTISTLNPM